MAFPKLLQKLFQNNGAGDKLNQDIIPVDSALSSTSENPVQNKVINSALDGKLSTSGGTMTGDISFSRGAKAIANAQNKGGKVEVGSDGAALLSNKDDFEGGATLLLRSSTYPNDQKGCFYLISALSASQRYNLVGTPDGTLTWGGKNVLTIVAESYEANSWYRKYSDGWIEQGGRFDFSNTRASTTFLHAFSDTKYSVVFCTNTSGSSWLALIDKTRFAIGSSSTGTAFWYACGK
nr:MAG TPA: hypothetical protein [Bacteriophage sp.]